MAITINLIKPEPGHDTHDSHKILNYETVTSYSWLDEPNPTILVPGIPPIWDPPQIGPVLSPDTGSLHLDQNADHAPGSPLQALIHATQTCQPSFDFTRISIVTDRKPVGHLLGFVRAEPTAFKFGVTIIGNTALFTRMEEHIPRHFTQYRDAFEAQYTKISASAAKTTSHHRVVKYDFAGETILLCYAVDAYLGDYARSSMLANGNESTDTEPLVKRHKDVNMNIKQHFPFRASPSDIPITVVVGGRHIPHAAILELTTRSEYSKSPDSIEHKMPSLWISQTLNYYLCLHRQTEHGSSPSTVFNLIRCVPMAGLLSAWEDNNAEKLRMLASVLTKIRKATEELGGSCIVNCNGGDGATLTVSRAEGGEVPVLPEDTQSLFCSVNRERGDVVFKREQVDTTANTACQDRKGKRKYGADDAPKLTASPPPKRTALNSIHRRLMKVSVPSRDGVLATGVRTTVYDGIRKRKHDAEDALGLTDSPPARRRALTSMFHTHDKENSPIK